MNVPRLSRGPIQLIDSWVTLAGQWHRTYATRIKGVTIILSGEARALSKCTGRYAKIMNKTQIATNNTDEDLLLVGGVINLQSADGAHTRTVIRRTGLVALEDRRLTIVAKIVL